MQEESAKCAFFCMKRLYIYIIVLLAVASCHNTYPEYDNVPRVEFLYAPVASDSADNKILFSFMLYDGDGNFGLEAKDTITPYIDTFQQNFYATAYSIHDGKSSQLPYNFSYRIPRLRAENQHKFIKAKVCIDITLAKSAFPYDSVFFTYFVYDRDLQKSNVDTSSIITF